MLENFSHIIRKFSHKLTDSEIIFFEKIFGNPEIVEHFRILQKKFYKFTALKILGFLGLLTIFIGSFFTEYTLIIILIYLFLGLWWYYYKEKQKEKFHETDFVVMKIFFQKIYEKIFHFGDFSPTIPLDEQKKDQTPPKMNPDYSVEIAKMPDEKASFLYQNREIFFKNSVNHQLVWKNVWTYRRPKSVMQYKYSLFSKLQIFNSKNTKNFSISPNNFDKKNFYLSVIFGGINLFFLIVGGIKILGNANNLDDLLSALMLMGLWIFLGVGIALWQIINFLRNKKSLSATENRDFNKIFYLHSDEKFSAEFLQLFVDFYNIRKFLTMFTISGNSLQVEREIPMKFFSNPHVSVKKNIERFIDFYLEAKILAEIAKKL